MRLGAKLTLAFLAVALIPAGAILAFTWVTVEERFQEEFQVRLDGVAAGIRSTVERIGAQIRQKVSALAQGDEVERILVELVRQSLDRGALIPEAGKWMKAWDLDLLSLLDGAGTVLSCGHLPARYGSKDEAALKIAADPASVTLQPVQVLREGKIESILAVMVGNRRRFGQAEVVVVGGKLLDQRFIAQLASLSGAEIDIVTAGDSAVVPKARAGVTYRRIPLPPEQEDRAAAYVVAGVSEEELDLARRRIWIASVAAAFVGVITSLILGLLISRKILGPVQALVQGARSVARGDLETRIEARSGGELRELVRTFNSMMDDLVLSRKKLVRAERVAAWQEIARRIAHEIKNPLSPIQMSIETLRKTYASGHPEFKEIFEESTRAILEEVANLKKIVTEFSDFARLPKPMLVVQDLNSVVEGTVHLYGRPQGERKLDFQRGQGLAPVAVDREQIGRVLSNLLSNAFWACGPQGHVRVITEQRKERVLLVVTDDGPGMPREVLEKVFTPYFTTRSDGTGLGLAIVQRIVEDHDGAVEIDSAPGRGTRVTLSFLVANSAPA